MKSNFLADIRAVVDDEDVLGVVLGEYGWGGYDEDSRGLPDQKRGVVLTWYEALPMLDYEYNDGYGAPDCNAIYIWTTDRVIFVVQYDGSTSFHSVPRNPKDCVPEMPGG